jgi:hypothetical protein
MRDTFDLETYQNVPLCAHLKRKLGICQYPKNAVIWVAKPFGFCKSQRFGGTYRFPHQDDKNWRARNNVSSNGQAKPCSELQLLISANVDPNSLVLVTLMIEAIHFSESSTLTRTTRSHIPEDVIIHSQCRENLRSYVSI